jgi:hypothetical protein
MWLIKETRAGCPKGNVVNKGNKSRMSQRKMWLIKESRRTRCPKGNCD